MQAADVYELRREAAPRRGRWWRRVLQLVTLVVGPGPVPGGGGRTVTGAAVADVDQRFGDDFYDVRLEDLITLPAAAFRDTLLSEADS